jgi:hypothetical protein
MAQVPYTSFYNGPFAVYTSPSGMSDPTTGLPYLGGSLHEGDYTDLMENEAQQWAVQFGTQLHAGRYRLVHLSPNAVTANIAFGKPAGWGLGTQVGQVAITAAGTGSGSGTFAVTSTTAGGTAATALVTVAAGVITGVQLVYPGSGMTTVPTFGLTEISAAGVTTSGTIEAQQYESPNFISSLDSSATGIYNVRGIFLNTPTAAQITAGAWVVIQELGIAPLLPTTAASVAAGSLAYVSATAGAVTVASITAGTTPFYVGTIGLTLDITNAGYLGRVILNLPVQQG